MESEALVVIRKSKPEDMALVESNWIKSQYWGSPHWSQMDFQEFRSNYAPVISKMLKSATIELAVLSDDTDMILGFIAYNGPILYWAYTKKDYRGKGILNLLLKNKSFTATTSTTLPGNAIRKKKKMKFNPFEE